MAEAELSCSTLEFPLTTMNSIGSRPLHAPHIATGKPLIVQSLETEMLIGAGRPLDKDMAMLRFWSTVGDCGLTAALSISPSSDEFVEKDWVTVEEDDPTVVPLLDFVDWTALDPLVDSLAVVEVEVLTAK